MKTRNITSAVLIGFLVVLSAGDLLAAGQGSMTRSRTKSAATTSVTRPADSLRRDGTFLTTGTTANGSTTRPTNGKGLQDGSGLTTTTVPTTAP